MRWKSLALASACLVLGAASAAHADDVMRSYSGVLTDVSPNSNGIYNGETFSLTFSYDPAAGQFMDEYGPHAYDYDRTGPISVEFNIGDQMSFSETDNDAFLYYSNGFDFMSGTQYEDLYRVSGNAFSLNYSEFGEQAGPVGNFPDYYSFIEGSGSFVLAASGVTGSLYQPMSAAPEPETWALLTAGVAAVGLSLRRRHFALI